MQTAALPAPNATGVRDRAPVLTPLCQTPVVLNVTCCQEEPHHTRQSQAALRSEEGGREGGGEGGREVGKEEWMEGGREGMEEWMEGGREGWREVGKEGGR